MADAILASLSSTGPLLTNFVANLLKTGKVKRTTVWLKSRQLLLDAYWTKFQDYHHALLTVADKTVLENEYFIHKIYDDIENCYVEALAVILGELEDLNPTVTQRQQGGLRGAPPPAAPAPSSYNSLLPLPKVPEFGGDYMDWPSFKDLFETMVHNDPSVTDVRKLYCLKLFLRDDAASLVKNVLVTGENYAVAWNALKAKYDNTRLICTTYLQKLTSLSTASDTAKSLKMLLNGTTETVQALKQLKRDVDHWDDWLVYITVTKLDFNSRQEWEASISGSSEMVKFNQLTTWLENRIRALEAMEMAKPKPQHKVVKAHAGIVTSGCVECHKDHFLGSCFQFRRKSVQYRRNLVQTTRLCWNCLSSDHLAQSCSSKSKCRRCDKAHHTLLHIDSSSEQQKSSKGTSDQPSTSNKSSSTSSSSHNSSSSVSTHIATNSVQPTVKSVLLATAIIRVQNSLGQFVNLRALFDQGSQATFVSEAAVQLLRIPKQKTFVSIYGVGATQTGTARASVNLRVSSVFCESNHDYVINALVLSTVTSILPPQYIQHQDWPHLRGLTLADPNFGQPGNIDIIIGADSYGLFLLSDIRKGTPDTPIAQQTIFGWVLSGPVTPSNHQSNEIVSFHVSTDESHNIDIELRQFWEVEEVSAPTFNSELDRQCEEHFVRTHTRDSTGRFCLRLPLKSDENGFCELGESRSIAVGTMCAMERRFRTNNQLKGDYSDFMLEYVQLGHMTPISSTDPVHHNVVCYLPHHAVIKTQSTTTKTRVVFNASQPTSTGKSLNDIVLTGPKLQRDIVGILTRWRIYAVCLQADIEKMYRQINIDPRDTDLQRIVWRGNPSDADFTDYRLTTVTYGTACAPYLAQRTLKQLAEDEKKDFPWACQVIANEFYVDDCLSGAATASAAIDLQSQLLTVLNRGGFSLRKWSSNRLEVLQHLPRELIDQSIYNFSELDTKKTLGVYWTPDTDTFGFDLQIIERKGPATKRTILSDIAKLFDPLGWLAPTIICAKLFLQRLWLAGVTWDEQLPTPLSDDWHQFRVQLHSLKNIQISRWIGVSSTIVDFEIHGFCDASIKAYGAVIYSRIVTSCGDVKISILAAKTKVASLKQNSLPRLELCGALLLTRLYTRLKDDIGRDIPFNAWSDSTITLSWLRGEPIRWRTFVGNRVAQIQADTNISQWRHVRSENNPADCASRGVLASELRDHPLWWTGPPWLKLSTSDWPQQPSQFGDARALEEEKSTVQVHAAINKRPWPLFEHFSSYTRLIRATAYWCRFIYNGRAVRNQLPKIVGSLTANELISARKATIRIAQSEDYYKEIDCIRANRSLPQKSKLFKLTPFLDCDGLLRVGGRLEAANISFDQKHPVILSKTNKLTFLIIDMAHRETMHGGPQLMLGHIRSKYWIVNGRNCVRKHVRECIICIRYRAQTKSQLMGNLPSQRITPTRAFLHTGVDYAGPIVIRLSKGRGPKTDKAYIAIFVCFSTKAVHIEAVSDYTSQTFLAAYRRFVSRRGHCSDLYSDCGTTFVGADKELRALHKTCMANCQEVAALVANDGTSWHFNPPSAPHMGGLWEAAVKSAKHHLKRSIGEQKLTYEELSTVLTQVEACLNSRPLCAIDSDSHDSFVLTPGHFLIGSPIISIPEPTIPTSGSLHKRWQVTQRIVQQFWRQWSVGYLGQLIERKRWCKEKSSLKVGDVVIIKDDLLPAAKWSLGRIESTHPGSDNLVRVVSVKCRGRIIQRPVVKLIPLLTELSKDASSCASASCAL